MVNEALLNKIETDLHIGPQFVALFEPFHTEENAMFLLAVVKYRRNPTWDGVLSIYHKHVSKKSKFQANLPAAAATQVENYVKHWGDMQTGFATSGVKLHLESAKADLFDAGFTDVLFSFANQVNQTAAQKQAYNAFKEKYNLAD